MTNKEKNVDDLMFLLNNYLEYAKDTFDDVDKNNFDHMNYYIKNQQDNNEVINDYIYKFIIANISGVIYKLIIQGNSYKSNIFLSIVKRIEKHIGHNILDQEKIHMQLLKIFGSVSCEKDKIEFKNEMIMYITLYSKAALNYQDTNKQEYLDKLFEIAIKYKQHGIIDKLKYHINIDKFIDINKNKKNMPTDVLLKSKGIKLSELFKNEYN